MVCSHWMTLTPILTLTKWFPTQLYLCHCRAVSQIPNNSLSHILYWGVLHLLNCEQIPARLDCFSHSITIETLRPARYKTATSNRIKHTPSVGVSVGQCENSIMSTNLTLRS